MWTTPVYFSIIAKKDGNFKQFALILKNRRDFSVRKKVWTGCGNVLSDPWKRGERLFQMGDSDRKIQIKLGL